MHDMLPLYRRMLGEEAWRALPPAIRDLHDGTGTWTAEGSASVERGLGLLAWLIAFINGFPKAGDDVPVSVRFDANGGREIWTRTFAGKSFSSTQYPGRDRSKGLICERFGPLVFEIELIPEQDRLQLSIRRWTVFGLPLPLFLGPKGETFERDEDSVFHFHVEIGFAWTGPIVRYRGWLKRR